MTKALLTCISGFGAKGPACFLLEARSKRILLDFGRGPDNDALPDLDRIGTVDALILSHGHRDHVGALPFLDRIGMPPIFATEWLQRDLPDVIFGGTLPACGSIDILGMRFTTGRTGHAPGGAWMHGDIGEGFLYTGDICPSSGFYPYDLLPQTRTAVIDASYGVDGADSADQRQMLLDLAQSGPCLLLAPADGRGPEIAAFLHAAGIQVSLDDAHIAAIGKLLGDPTYLQPGMADVLDRLLIGASRLQAWSEPEGAMIVTGASRASGLARELLQRWKSLDRPAIVLTGHAAAGSLAEALLVSGRAQNLRWNVHPNLQETRSLLRSIGARRVIAAFASRQKLDALAAEIDIVSAGDPIEIL